MSLVTVRRVRLLLPVSCVCACLSRPQRVSLGRATCTDAMENSARAFGSQLVCRKRVNINILISLLIFFFCFSWECDAPGVNACATSMRTRHAPRTSLVRGFGRGFELCSTRADPPLLNSSGGAPPSERRWMESCKNQRSFAPALSPNFLCRMTQNVTPLPASLSPPPRTIRHPRWTESGATVERLLFMSRHLLPAERLRTQHRSWRGAVSAWRKNETTASGKNPVPEHARAPPASAGGPVDEASKPFPQTPFQRPSGHRHGFPPPPLSAASAYSSRQTRVSSASRSATFSGTRFQTLFSERYWRP